MRTQIKVTRKDIKNGIARMCQECPIALAINRALKEQFSAFIAQIHVPILPSSPPCCSIVDAFLEMSKLSCIYAFSMPYKAQLFICHYDDGCDVKPFNFVLDIPAKFLR